jgi:hypothetical protein
LPPEAKVSARGLAFAAATRSASERIPVEGCTTSRLSFLASAATGARSAIAKKGRRSWDYEQTAIIERCLIERGLIVIRRFAQFNPRKLQAELGGGAPRCFPLVCGQLVPEHGRGQPIRKAILDELNPLCGQLDLLEDDTCNIAGGPRQACDVTASERIVIDGNHHNRHGPRNGERRLQADFRADSKDDIRLARCELPVQGFILVCARSLQKIKGEITSFLITEFEHAPFESYPLR